MRVKGNGNDKRQGPPEVAALLLAGIGALYFIIRPRHVTEETFAAAEEEAGELEAARRGE